MAKHVKQTSQRIIEEHSAVENALALYGLASDYKRMEVWRVYEREGVAAALRYIKTMSHREA